MIDPDYGDNDDILTFIEEELGPYDAARNWEQYRTDPKVRDKVASWLAFFAIKTDPDQFISDVSRFIKAENGQPWQWFSSPKKSSVRG